MSLPTSQNTTITKHYPTLQGQGSDVFTMTSLPFVDAALGTKVPIKGLDGGSLMVTIPPGTQSGTSLRLHGRGMPRLEAKGKGDLFAIVEVRTSTHLTPPTTHLAKRFRQARKEQGS